MSKYRDTLIEFPERVSKLGIAVVLTLLLNIIIVIMVAVLFREFTGSGARRDWAVDVQASQEFKPGQAVTITVEMVTVYVPPFAIPLPGSVYLTTRDGDQFPAKSEVEWSRPQAVEVQFRNAEGTSMPELDLAAPIKTCFTLTDKQWQDLAERPGSIEIQYYTQQNNVPAWLSLPMTSDPDLLQLCARTDHLSIFALAIRVEPSDTVLLPVTGPSATPTPTVTPSHPSPIDTRERREPARTPTSQPTRTLVPTRTLPPTATKTLRPTSTPLPTSTKTLKPTPTLLPTLTHPPTSTRPPTSTPRPTATRTRRPTSTPRPTSTQAPTETNAPPTATDPPPTATRPPSTATRPPATATRPPATATRPPATATRPPPTATRPPATATRPPPTATRPPPPTATDVPPTKPPPPTTYP